MKNAKMLNEKTLIKYTQVQVESHNCKMCEDSEDIFDFPPLTKLSRLEWLFRTVY